MKRSALVLMYLVSVVFANLIIAHYGPQTRVIILISLLFIGQE